jgi:hypothetical protein
LSALAPAAADVYSVPAIISTLKKLYILSF